MYRAVVVGLGLLAVTGWAQKNPDLQRAQDLLAQRKYSEALKALESAEKKGGMDRDSYLTLLESKALAYASTNKLESASEYFRSVLCLEPKRDFSGKYAGAVARPVAEAIEWVKQNGGLELTPLEPGVEDGRVKQISFAVKNDPLRLVKAVKFYVRSERGSWKPTPASVVNGAASLDVNVVQVEWWAEANDLNNNQVAFLGSALRPIKSVAEREARVEPKQQKVAEVKMQPIEEPQTPVSSSPIAVVTAAPGSPLRPISYGVAGGGLVALGVGALLGMTYNSERQAIRQALIAGGASAALYDRDQAAIRQAVWANALFIGGGALLGTGVILWLLGGDSTGKVSVVPLGFSGLAVQGVF